MLRLTPSDLYTFFRPQKCENRIYLRDKGLEEAPLSPYEEVIRRLGERHELAHLSQFPVVADLRSGSLEDREKQTREGVQKQISVIYQAVMRASYKFGALECEIIGSPDFLIREADNYIIRDSKISRRINEQDHPEIILQLQLYGWLYEQTFGREPSALEVHAGTGEVIRVPYDGGTGVLGLLEEILVLKTLQSEAYSPVGWTKCGGCPFHDHCWPRAEKHEDVALVYGVDQGLAAELNRQGISTITKLIADFDEATLADFKRPWGNKFQKVGKKASSILLMARVTASKQEVMIEQPQIPDFPNYVMFDLEGLPPHLDELDKIYLWGLQVFGEKPSIFLPALAGFGEDGDKKGWDAFLKQVEEIFAEYGDIPFVHWHHYERVRIDMYVKRYGDPNGTAARVRRNLLDLLPVAQKSIALPLASYSLKVVEKYIGFKRTQDEYGGDWAMAKYIEATELEDTGERERVVNDILTYNREDLAATWEVLLWLRSKIN
jgi:predicted RecB family nuclease